MTMYSVGYGKFWFITFPKACRFVRIKREEKTAAWYPGGETRAKEGLPPKSEGLNYALLSQRKKFDWLVLRAL